MMNIITDLEPNNYKTVLKISANKVGNLNNALSAFNQKLRESNKNLTNYSSNHIESFANKNGQLRISDPWAIIGERPSGILSCKDNTTRNVSIQDYMKTYTCTKPGRKRYDQIDGGNLPNFDS